MRALIRRITPHIAGPGWRYGPGQFRLFVAALALYLLWHFVLLVPYAPELFARSGMIADPTLLPTYGIFPNLLVLMDSARGTQMFVATLALLTPALLWEKSRPWAAVALWYGWACLFNRNIFIANPGLPFVGWLLLACALVPRTDGPSSLWRLPAGLYWGAWVIMALGYTVSGIHKMGSPSWADGTAILRLLENPLARDVPWRRWLLDGPRWVTTAQTYGSLALEVLFLPLALSARTRPWVWTAMVGMHLSILSLVSFADLTLGVLLAHLFTFDARWLAVYSAARLRYTGAFTAPSTVRDS